MLGVEIDKRGGGLVVGGHADFDGFGAIVFALEESGAATIADVLAFGRLVGDVEDGFAFGAGAAATEARNDFFEWQFVVDYGVEEEIFFLQKLREGFGLGKCARESVEEEATGATETASAFANHFPNRGIGDEGAATHEIKGGGHGG